MFEFCNLDAENVATNPPFELLGQHRGREAEKAFYQFQSTCSFIFLVWPSGGLISCFLSAECIGLGMAAVRG